MTILSMAAIALTVAVAFTLCSVILEGNLNKHLRVLNFTSTLGAILTMISAIAVIGLWASGHAYEVMY